MGECLDYVNAVKYWDFCVMYNLIQVYILIDNIWRCGTHRIFFFVVLKIDICKHFFFLCIVNFDFHETLDN